MLKASGEENVSRMLRVLVSGDVSFDGLNT